MQEEEELVRVRKRVDKKVLQEASLEGELKVISKRVEKLEAEKERLSRRAEELDRDVRQYELNNKRTALDVEQARIKHMSPIWVGIVLLTLFVKYASGSLLAKVLTEFAFLLNWRGLYVKRNFYFSVVAAIMSLLIFAIMK
jgi:hypothetical protein